MSTPRLDAATCATLMPRLHPDWQLSPDASRLARHFTFKGFAKPSHLAALAAWFADRTGHHPDIAFGWGYCTIIYTTHDIGGLSQADFTTAAQFDALIA